MEPEGEDEPEGEAGQGCQEDDDDGVPAVAAVAEVVVGVGGGVERPPPDGGHVVARHDELVGNESDLENLFQITITMSSNILNQYDRSSTTCTALQTDPPKRNPDPLRSACTMGTRTRTM